MEIPSKKKNVSTSGHSHAHAPESAAAGLKHILCPLFGYDPRNPWNVIGINFHVSPVHYRQYQLHSFFSVGNLQDALTNTFLDCGFNRRTYLQLIHHHGGGDSPDPGKSSSNAAISFSNHIPVDVVILVPGGPPIEAHRLILIARSPYFKRKFETDWKNSSEVTLAEEEGSYSAVYILLYFFYSDTLHVARTNRQYLVRLCQKWECKSLLTALEEQRTRQQQYADIRIPRILERLACSHVSQFLPEQDHLPASLNRILLVSLAKSTTKQNPQRVLHRIPYHLCSASLDWADVCILVDGKTFRSHQVILASRSEYLRALFSHKKDSGEGKDESPRDTLLCVVEPDLTKETFEIMLKYMYTDHLEDIDPHQVVELFDAASRYLLFPLKGAVADKLIHEVEGVSPTELCSWLLLSDLYDVSELREHCLETITHEFLSYSPSTELQIMLLTLAQSSSDTLLPNTVQRVLGAVMNTNQRNLLSDLRERWIESNVFAAEDPDKRALQFDKHLEMLMRNEQRWIESNVFAAEDPDERALQFDKHLEMLMRNEHNEPYELIFELNL